MELPSSQQRDVVKTISPPWMSIGTNEKYMYNLGLACDALLEKLNQAMRAHMPIYAPPSALPYLGKDRVMSQGPLETDSDFVLRLQKSLDTWQLAGSRRAVMQQALLYVATFAVAVAGQVPEILTVSSSGSGTYAIWDTYYNTSDTNEAPVHVRVAPSNWDWDGQYKPWRAWLVFFFDATSTLQPEETWGNGTWGEEGGSWGLNVDPSTFQIMRILVRLWKSAGTYYNFFIISWNSGDGGAGDDFSPYSSPGSGNPDGTWGRWGILSGGVYQQARPDTDRFVDGTAIYQDCTVPTGT